MAGHLNKLGGVEKIISGKMSQPTFPVPLEKMGSKLTFEDFTYGDTFSLGKGTKVITTPLNHPDGATGYRVEYRGKSMCYITDTEHVIGKPDQKILKIIEGADLVIFDLTYTDKEFPNRMGWGHSTRQEGVRLC